MWDWAACSSPICSQAGSTATQRFCQLGRQPMNPKITEHHRRGRSARTALDHSSHLGWAEIRHPFHPLRGQRFEVLKKRRIAGVDTLILRECQRGSFSIAREWTDWADPSSYDSLGFPPQRLDANSLFELVTLLEQLAGSQSGNKKD